MPTQWPTQRYQDWSETCDTLHAHTQDLGKLAVAIIQHLADDRE